MSSYTEFAYVYDTFMDNTPYEKWKSFVMKVLKEHQIDEGLILDLGCGTGTMTELLAEEGYDMIGVDNSSGMLMKAMEKREESGHDILYLLQDMTEFELYGTVKAIVSVCDCINYLLEEEELLRTFRLVNNYLDPKGIFIFDFNTPYKYRDVIGEKTIAENREECSFIWDNYYDEKDQINEYDLTLFVKNEEGTYDKFTETHVQRGYEKEQIKRLLEQAGLEVITFLDEETEGEVTSESERIYAVARERGK